MNAKRIQIHIPDRIDLSRIEEQARADRARYLGDWARRVAKRVSGWLHGLRGQDRAARPGRAQPC